MNTFLLHNKCTVGDIKKEKKTIYPFGCWSGVANLGIRYN